MRSNKSVVRLFTIAAKHFINRPSAAMLCTLVLATIIPFGSTLGADSLALVYDDGMGGTVPYRLFLPPGYDTPGAEFPLVLYHHGGGRRGDDNISQLGNIGGLIDATQSERFASFLLAPQAPVGTENTHFSSNTLHPYLESVTQIIALLESQYQIDTSQRYVTGHSLGGSMALALITKRPDMFAAAVPMSGGGNSSFVAADMADVRLWAMHGRHDSSVDVSLTRSMIAALIDVGSDPLYLELNAGHGIGMEEIYNDLNGELYPWMFEGVAPPLATAIYNPQTGNLKLDARSAPGGTIDDFSFRLRELVSLQPTMTVDGVVVNTLDFVNLSLDSRSNSTLTYNNTLPGGFSGIADFGPIMSTSLSMQDFHQLLVAAHEYSSPATGSESRTFRLIMEVPEPTTGLLLMLGMAALLTTRRTLASKLIR